MKTILHHRPTVGKTAPAVGGNPTLRETADSPISPDNSNSHTGNNHDKGHPDSSHNRDPRDSGDSRGRPASNRG